MPTRKISDPKSVKPDELVELTQNVYKDPVIEASAPGQILRRGTYPSKDVPAHAFEMGLVRKVTGIAAKSEPEVQASLAPTSSAASRTKKEE